jgi:RNA polymerase sigma-70 factor, ECF subfamily
VFVAFSPPMTAVQPVTVSIEALFSSYGRHVWRSLLHFGVPERDVEDACQEVFVVAHRKLQEGISPEHPAAWLHGISFRVAAAHRRKAQHAREVPSDDLDDGAAGPESGPCVDRKRRLESLDRALTALGDEQRAVFVLYEIEQLTMREVASALETSINTCFSRLYAARKRVADELGIAVPKEVWKR